jgi:hypothetical protein
LIHFDFGIILFLSWNNPEQLAISSTLQNLTFHVLDQHRTTDEKQKTRKKFILRTSHQRPNTFLPCVRWIYLNCRVSNFTTHDPKVTTQPSVTIDAAIIVEVGVFEFSPGPGTLFVLTSVDLGWIVE